MLGILVASAAVAEDVSPEAPFLDELPVVLSMTRMPQRIDDAPGAVTLFTREDIERLGYRRLPQLLRLVPGMNMISDTAHSPGLFYHGLGSLQPNRMQVLIDGRSVYSPYLFGYVDWDALPLTMDEIERIEVVRGANASSYGSNAVAGVVNIVTRTSMDGPAASAQIGVGNRGARDASVRMRRSFGPLSIALNARTMGDEGYSQRFDDSRTNAVTMRGDLTLDASDEINFMAGQSVTTRGFGHEYGVSGNRDNGNGYRDAETDNRFLHVRFRRLLSTDNEWSVGFYMNEDKGIEEYLGQAADVANRLFAENGLTIRLPPYALPIDYNRTARRRNLDFQQLMTFGDQWRLSWGAELRHEELESARMFYDDGRESDSLARVSANLEWRPSDTWTVNAGNMIEKFHGQTPKASPRLHATWHATRNHALKAGVTRAYRQPSLVERYGDSRFIYPDIIDAVTALDPVQGPLAAAGLKGGRLKRTYVGSPGLAPERLDSAELGYVGQWGSSTLDVRVFHERFSHLVTERSYQDPDYFNNTITFVEGPGVIIQGLEYQYRYRGADREIWFSHAIPRIHTREPCSDPRATCPDTTVPSSTWSLTWLESFARNWSVAATLYAVNGAEWFNDSERIASYQTVDVRVAKRFRSGGAQWEAALLLTDVGQAYETFNDNRSRIPFNTVGRQTLLTLRASWF